MIARGFNYPVILLRMIMIHEMVTPFSTNQYNTMTLRVLSTANLKTGAHPKLLWWWNATLGHQIFVPADQAVKGYSQRVDDSWFAKLSRGTIPWTFPEIEIIRVQVWYMHVSNLYLHVPSSKPRKHQTNLGIATTIQNSTYTSEIPFKQR